MIVVVAGLSGAGKSTALAALEDLGFHTVENLPPSVVVHAVEACEQAGIADIALGVGGSVPGFLEGAADVVAALSAGGRRVKVLFLDASDEVVTRRFSETRRPHPLSAAAKGDVSTALSAVAEGVRLERERLAPLRALAELVIDTSGLRVHDLRKRILATIRPDAGAAPHMSTRILSFGFKYGLPNDADVVLDVRFLDNPYFIPELAPLTGEDPRVQRHVLEAAGAREFLEKTADLLAFLLPRYDAEGKSYLTVAVGCTGGQHRSVALAIALRARLAGHAPGPISLAHRDMPQGGSRPASDVPGGGQVGRRT